MAAIPVRLPRSPARTGSTLLRRVLDAALKTARTAVSPHRASLSRLLESPFALAGTACIDFAAFRWHAVGWLVTGASLWLWNEICSDDGPGTA